MPSILDIRVQKLFLITIILKVGSSFLGWFLQKQWSLGFSVPLGIMALYIVLGLQRRDNDVTDEKFADSCYYLGFIFTITSIIFSLFDLPSIGTKIQEIAVRFGAAMVSTVAGLVVRVYLVSFKKDLVDAIKDSEEAIIETSEKFREQLIIAFERLCDFQSEIDNASKATVERVNMQIEKLSKDHADKLTSFFAELTARNQEAFTSSLAEVRTASLRLSESVDGYSQGMRTHLGSVEDKVIAFTEAIAERLKATTFPDDYFAKHLEPPLKLLKEAVNDVSSHVLHASKEVSESTVVLAGSLKKLKTKAAATEKSLETVVLLSAQQHAVLDAAQGQLTTLEKLGTTLSNFDALLSSAVAGLNATTVSTTVLTGRVETVVLEGAQARKQLEASLLDVVSKLASNAAATDALSTSLERTAVASQDIASRLEMNTIASQSIVAQLGLNTTATKQITDKLNNVELADIETTKSLAALGDKASSAVSKVDAAEEHLKIIARQFASLDSALRSQSSDLKQVVERLRDVRVVVKTPSSGDQIGQPPVILQHQPQTALSDGNGAVTFSKGLRPPLPPIGQVAPSPLAVSGSPISGLPSPNQPSPTRTHENSSLHGSQISPNPST